MFYHLFWPRLSRRWYCGREDQSGDADYQ